MCPTCSATLEKLCHADGKDYWHCPRCGTNVVEHVASGWRDIYEPKLVDRCRKFGEYLARYVPGQGETLPQCSHRLGIAESIANPEDRP